MKILCTIKSILVIVCLALTSNLIAQTAVDAYGQLRVSGNKMVGKNGDPVQLQGMSLFWSQWEPEFYTAGAVKQLKDDWCTNIVRAAMAVENGGYLTNPTAEKNKVKTIVDAAIAEGMYVIIDWHDHNAHQHQSQAVAFFSEMAQTYGDHPNVIYEVFNEPLNISWANTIKPYCEAVIAAIRQHDPDNIVVCGTRQWDQRPDEVIGNEINDDNVMYTFHYYAGSHGNQERNWANTAINAGIPLFVTEFGNVNADGNGGVNTNSSNTWFNWMNQHDLSFCNWSLCDKDEGSAVLRPGTSANATYVNNLTAAGTFMLNHFKSQCPDYSSLEDCNGDQNGNASIDDCGVCSGGNTGVQPNSTCSQDCNGVFGGSAFIDDCDNCVGGNTGQTSCNQSPYGGVPHMIPGTIEAEEYDEGGEGVAYNDGTDGNEGSSSLRNDNVDIEPTSDNGGGNNIGWTEAGEWLEYTVDVASSGEYSFEVRVASNSTVNNMGIRISLDGNNEEFDVSVPFTGDWQGFESVVVDNVQLVAGEQIMRITLLTEGFNINYIKVLQLSQSGQDCNGDVDGTAYLDGCNVCVGGNTGKVSAPGCDPTGIVGLKNDQDVSVYPIPSSDIVTIETNNTDFTQLRVLNVSGVEIKSEQMSSNNHQLDLSEFQKGIYFIQLLGQSNSGRIKVVKN